MMEAVNRLIAIQGGIVMYNRKTRSSMSAICLSMVSSPL
jgi:adenine deaminase